MLGQGGPARDRAMVAVAKAGALRETGEACEPYQLIDPAGMPAESAAAYFRDLQAAGRSAWNTITDEMDLLTLGTFAGPAGTFRQTAELTKPQRDLLAKLKIAHPKKIIEATPAAAS
jgi:hypothetical protein